MKQKPQRTYTVLLITLVAVAIFCAARNSPTVLAASSNSGNTFYVGVTYCGNSVGDAKQLIDKVKDYTNLFVLQSGSLQTSNASIDAIGDYVVNSGLNFIVYMGVSSFALANNWLSGYNGRWGSHFLGIYLDDEPGGKMLDGQTYLNIPGTYQTMIKTGDGTISGYVYNDTNIDYMRNGTVDITKYYPNLPYFSYFTYYPNGTVTTHKENDSPEIPVTDTSTLPYTYDELWSVCPIGNFSQATEIFTGQINRTITTVRSENSAPLKMLTSDYALQWFDYQSGYDVVLTELGSNQSETQSIAQARGAANLFGKDWGAMLTWKYTQAPYLADGNQIYQQMCQAYKNGAKYVVIFNYAPDMKGPDGILQPEHFQALQRFWTEEVNNASVKRGQVKADAAFVLPHDFGSGLRRQSDVVWGLWDPTEQQQQTWLQLQDALAQYGQKLDVVYQDPTHQVAGKYATIIGIGQPSSGLPITLIEMVSAVVAIAIAGVLLTVQRYIRSKANTPKKKSEQSLTTCGFRHNQQITQKTP